MEAILQKYGWALNLLFIAIGAMILAFAASEVIAVYLAPYRVPDVVSDAQVEKEEKKPVRRPTRQRSFSRAIVERCLFGCPEEEKPVGCEEPCAAGEVCKEGQCVPMEPTGTPDGIPVLSDMKVKLLGAMVAFNPDYSVALIQDPSSKTSYVAGVGEFIGPDAEVLEIYRDRVIIKRNGRLEFIKLDSALQGNPSGGRTLANVKPSIPSAALKGKDLKDSRAAKLTPTDPAEAKAAAEAKKKEGVKAVGENTFEIERSAIEEQLNDPKKLAKQAQIIPNYKDGKRDGIKLIGVTPGGVFGKIGIQSGDVVHGINGQKVTSQNRALELLDGLRKANNVKIEVERGGRRQTIEYSIK